MIHNTLFKKTLFFLGIILTVLLLPKISLADTHNAASCSQADVQAAINSASNGDTVIVPAGECNWSSRVSVGNKQLTVIGAGIGQTNITGYFFAIASNQSCRITGFSLDATGIQNPILIYYSQNFRIDHCSFVNNGTGFPQQLVYAYGAYLSQLTGLFDNNTIVNMGIDFFGEPNPPASPPCTSPSCPGGNDRWFESLDIGTSSAVYMEDNTFYCNNGNYCQNTDTNQGGRYVFRFNHSYGNYTEFHSVQGGNRAGRLFEIYGNTYDCQPGQLNSAPMRLRGGTGVVWGNQLTGTGWANPNINFDNVRSYDYRAPAGKCDGTSSWDGNQDSSGWPCRDQIGRSTDAWLWTDASPYPTQSSKPVYLWLNRKGANIFAALVATWESPLMAQHIKNNRDYYDEATSFDGTSGTGYGTLASRPTTCTPGVAYWATDQGNWNKKPGGQQGVLYKCTATDTWTTYYTPYTYPHPLRAEATPDTTPPAPPSGVTVN